MREAFQVLKDWQDDLDAELEQQSGKPKPTPPTVQVPTTFNWSAFLRYMGWSETMLDEQPDDYVHREHSIWQLRCEYGQL